ncbi:MAG: VWA domain-containing protein, partial [Methanobacterium paludis]|nr:VWA domain-containing protein [Methanobacterium paludis]
MPIQFNVGSAALLLLGLGLAAACFFFWWFHRQTITDMSAGRKRVALALRLAIVTLLFLALAGLRWVKKNDSLAVVFVLDASKSIREDQRDSEVRFVNDAMRGRRPTDTVGLVTFGQDPDVQVAADKQLGLSSVRHNGSTNATDISQAMGAALPLIPRGMAGKVVVLSDGNENIGSALSEVPIATGQGVRVESLMLPSNLQKETLVEKLVVPARVKIGEPFVVKVITNTLNAQPARLTLRRDGQQVGAPRDIQLTPHRQVFPFECNIDKPGFYRFEATLETGSRFDTILENNKGLGFVSVRGKPQVLYVAQTPAMIGFLRRALREQNIDVQFAPPAAMPTTPAALQQFDSVILSDVPRDAFSDAQLAALQMSV